MALTAEQDQAPLSPDDTSAIEPTEQVELLMRDLRSSPQGLSGPEAKRRLLQYGPNELHRRGGLKWPAELGHQLTHPLALLLWLAAALSFAVGSKTVAIAVLLVIALNAVFALIQEMQAERAVEALAQFLPQKVRVLRDGTPQEIVAVELVPGDIVLVEEGDRIAADMRMISGAVEVDLSTLNGESASALRSAELIDPSVARIAAQDLLFSGTSATGGEARGVVFATGMRTELGRIAALSERVKEEPSPLEAQVRKVAWLIAAIAIAMAVAFVPLAIFGAGLSLTGQHRLRRRPARRQRARGPAAGHHARACRRRQPARTTRRSGQAPQRRRDARLDRRDLHRQDRHADREPHEPDRGVDARRRSPPRCRAPRRPTTTRLLLSPKSRGRATTPVCSRTGRTRATRQRSHFCRRPKPSASDVDAAARERARRHQYNFDPQRKLMSTLDACEGHDLLATKGAPEAVLPRCSTAMLAGGEEGPFAQPERERVTAAV